MASGPDDAVRDHALDTDALRRLGRLAESGRGPSAELGPFARDLMVAVRGDMVRIWRRHEDEFELLQGVSRAAVSDADRQLPAWGESIRRVTETGTGIALARGGQTETPVGPDLFLVPLGSGEPPAVVEICFDAQVKRELAAVRFEAAEWACGLWSRAGTGGRGSAAGGPRAATATPGTIGVPGDGDARPHRQTATDLATGKAAATDPASAAVVRLAAELQRASMTNEVCRVVANEGARLVGCDRLSVVLRNGRTFRVEAVTGREEVHRRAEIVKALRKLAKPICRSEQAFVFDGSDEKRPPEIERPLHKLAEQGGAVGVVAMPLYKPTRRPLGDEDRDEADLEKGRGRPTAVLIAEWLGEPGATADLTGARARLGDVVAWSERPLAAARERGRVPLWRLQRLAGSVATELWGRRKLLTTLVIAAVTATTAALCLVTVPYRFTATGTLMPESKRRVFANVEGEVARVLVDGGVEVAAGERLVELENEPLQIEIVTVASDLSEKRRQLVALAARRSTAHGEDAVELEGELEMTRAEISGLMRRGELLATRAADLAVDAPIDGVVATFRAKERLLGRPVARGDVLVEVMDPDGPWRLELSVPESRVGHLKSALNEADGVAVEYLILTEPEVTHAATLHTLSNRTDPSPEGSGEVDALAALDPADLPGLRIGAEVRARV
ncbi:MAG: HlyD family efflux transporter periplasmic adaptor subunit, partial [Planctomycetota bacterium]